MSEPCQLIRYCNQPELARRAAARLLASLIELQADGRVAQLCLTGGRAALATYAELGELVPGSALDPSRLELWWGDERFVPTDGTDRNAGPTLALLARHFLVDPARTHPMPSADGQVDAAASAATYAKELGETRFDLCILGVGVDGEVAAIFPGHPSAEPSTQSVIGVTDAPKGPPERISLTIETINRSREVWLLASGQEKAEVVSRAVAGDSALPAGRVSGRRRTLWLVDEAAAAKLPYYECSA
ncbi:6-phosphogluconolactonase [Propionicimonas paludicola]|uniref:6-phosphogluconolactonase n=1 Tax=Propionicimonas paludicola TaxID=185243 RepID=A0A2A9CTH7_9ACTN|nr:6-phosphogluconolactonase [Propionicimonas paludicola]PFG16932.1 6-phosphogluconolactonase [Propionicimonas paludicola]